MTGWVDRGIRVAVVSALGCWLGLTAASQHPQRMFDRVRERDRTGLLIPNWRFFAPEPARHDFHVLHRVLTADDEPTSWSATTRISPRALRQVVWFPSRRREKAVFDICTELLLLTNEPTVDITATSAYRILRHSVVRTVLDEFAQARPQGCQFVIARHTGHDEQGEPEFLFVSPFIPIAPRSSGRHDQRAG